MRLTIILALCTISTTAAAQDVPAKYKAILVEEARMEGNREAERQRVQATLDKDKKLLERIEKNSIVRATVAKVFIPEDESKQILFPTRAQKDKHIAAGKAAVAASEITLTELKRPVRYQFPFMVHPPKVGDIGLVGQIGPVKALQVIDKETLLVRVDFPVEAERKAVFMMLKWDTKNVVDDQELKPLGPMEVTGTRTYRSVGGSDRTVLVMQPFDLEALDSWRKKLSQKK